MELIEEQLKDFMLENVSFVLDGKTIKQGKIRLYNTKQCFIRFKLDNNNELKDWEIPYPYKVQKTSTGLLLDYCLSAFCPRTEDVYWKMFLMDKSAASKIHNNYLHVIKLSS